MFLKRYLVNPSRDYPFILIFIVALVLRLGYLAEIVTTPLWEWHTLQITDTDTFLTVAGQIRDGDVLVHYPYHPYRTHSWIAPIASEDEWQRWLGPHNFYQAPGYYYFLAGLLAVFSGSLGAVRIAQLVMGAVHAGLLGAVGQKILGRRGGIAVGLLAASYGPFIAVESMVLREGLGLFLATTGIYLVLRALERKRTARSEKAGIDWVTAGAVLGIGALVKETGLVLLASVLCWAVFMRWRKPGAICPRSALLILVGAVMTFLPLGFRNLAVDAPPGAYSALFPFNFAFANAIDAPAGGVFFSTPPSLRSILERSEARVIPTVIETLRPYAANPGRVAEKIGAKWVAMWSNVELPDNFSYDYFSRFSVLLTLLPRFASIWLLALLGIGLIVLVHSRHLHVGIHPSVIGLMLLASILAMHLAAQSFTVVMSRYRLVIVPFLMIPAGFALGMAYEWVMTRRWRLATAWVCGLGLLSFVWLASPVEARLRIAAMRPIDFAAGAASLANHNNLIGAWGELEQGIQYCRTHAALAPGEAAYAELMLRRDRLLLFVRRGRFTEVRDDWDILRRAVGEDEPSIQEVRRFLAEREQDGN